MLPSLAAFAKAQKCESTKAPDEGFSRNARSEARGAPSNSVPVFAFVIYYFTLSVYIGDVFLDRPIVACSLLR